MIAFELYMSMKSNTKASLSQIIKAPQMQLAECQENNLIVIRDLEKTKEAVDTHDSIITAQSSPDWVSQQVSQQISQQVYQQVSDDATKDWTGEHQQHLQTFRSQLESMCQSLHYLILLCKEQLNKVTHSGPWLQSDISAFDAVQQSVQSLLSKVKQVREMEGDFMFHPSQSVNERILRQNEELINFVARISEEKTKLRNTLAQFDVDVWQYRQMDTKYQTIQRSTQAVGSQRSTQAVDNHRLIQAMDSQRSTQAVDSQIIAERAQWAMEKLALQTALNSAVREVNLLQAGIHTVRENIDAVVFEENDCNAVKLQRLNEKYLRAESFRKALIYQKKYLLLLLGGFQDSEKTMLTLLTRMSAVDGRTLRRNRCRPILALRAAVRVVIAIHRMKCMVNRWRQATGVGAEVGGPMDPFYGYMPTASSFSTPRQNHSPCIVTTMTNSLSPSPPRHNISPFRQTPAVLVSDTGSLLYSARHNVDVTSPSSYQSYTTVSTTCCLPNTSLTKDYRSTTTHFNMQSSGARRSPSRKSPQEHTVLISPQEHMTQGSSQEHVTSSDINNGDILETDDYIKKLENLNSKMGTLNKFTGRQHILPYQWR